jgi:hypothetical protein
LKRSGICEDHLKKILESEKVKNWNPLRIPEKIKNWKKEFDLVATFISLP